MKTKNETIPIKLKLPPSKLVRGDQFEISNSCNRPFYNLTIDADGNCFLCACEAWLPISVGNIKNFQSIEEIFSSPVAQKLQNAIKNRDYSWCAVARCGILDHDVTLDEYVITVNLDVSCNLACPSCRREMKNITKGDEFDRLLDLSTHFLKLLEKFKKPAEIIMLGSGDPLASMVIRPILLNWTPAENQKLSLKTNGLLMKKLLPNSSVFNRISKYLISIDAGTEKVYEIVRFPGKFKNLIENLDWLYENKPKHAEVNLSFTLSANNALDVENFVALCEHYKFFGQITALEDWHTFDNFSSQAVLDFADHPLYNDTITQLQRVAKKNTIWIAYNINSLL